MRESQQRWRSAVAGVLAKSTRRDPSDLPPEPESLLDSPTYEGFAIRALYTSLDALPEPPLPGEWPFVRGGDALRDVKSGWKVAEAFPVPGQKAVTDGNGAVLVALTEGVSALVLRVGAPDGVAAADLDRLLEGVFLDLVPVVLDAGADLVAASDALLPQLTDMDDEQRGRLSIDLGADPLTEPLSRRPAADIADVVATAAKVTAYAGGVRTITVDGPAFHNLGANASWELAGAVAAGVAYLRRLGDAGLSVSDSLRQISFRLAADDDQFMTIAKFRVLRRLWARVAEVVGEPDAGAARVHAVTSMPMMAQRDPWVNMLRTTVAAFGAGVGGADTVLVAPFDAAIPGGLPGTAASLPAESPATRSCCCWRSPISVRFSTPQAAHGSSRTSPSSSPRRRGRTSNRSRRTAASSRPVTSSPLRSPRCVTGAATTSPIAGLRSPGSTNTRTSVNRRSHNTIRRA